MSKKRNFDNKIVSTSGYVQKYFGTDISRILVPNDRNIHNCEDTYVPHLEAEMVLSDCLIRDQDKDKSLVFTGLTGSGKTTILRHVFGFNRQRDGLDFQHNAYIMHIDFNRSQSDAQVGILSSLRVTVNKICETYGIEFPDLQNEQFYEYIKKENREDFTQLDARHGRNTPFTQRLETFLNERPVQFASCQLQYVMENPACVLDLVVMVVDNIEGFMDPNAKNPQGKYLSPVIEAYKLADCIAKRNSPSKWSFNMVISCRHHIWRIMTGEFSDNSSEGTLLQSYATTEVPYDLAEPVKVKDIVKKREEVFAMRQRGPQKWDTAVKVVNTVLEAMEAHIGDFVLQIELKDMRKSMAKMQELILHKGLQRVSDEKLIAGAFRIDSVEQFDLTRVNIVRILGLGNNTYYASQSSIIPNLLCNDSTREMDLYPLLTLKYFLRMCDFTEPNWESQISVPEFYDGIKLIFGEENTTAETMFHRSVEFLIKNRLLLRSADQPQEEAPGLSRDEIQRIEYVYISGSAIALWKELGKSSALFQLFLDDIWLETDSDFFTENGNDIEHCVTYLKHLFQTEKQIFNSAANIGGRHKAYYLDSFGVTPVCKQLLNGLISSLNAVKETGYSRSQSRIRAAQESLKEAKKLREAIDKWSR
jgi:hypothetical protein